MRILLPAFATSLTRNDSYPNGIDVDEEGTVHVTWCWRDYVPVKFKEKPQQAGPNGPENVRHDLVVPS